MKKLLILMLVLGLASAANAVIVQLSVDGSTDGAGNTTTVTSLSTLGIVSDTDGTEGKDMRLTIGDGTYGDYGTIVIWNNSGSGTHTDGGNAGDDSSVTDLGVVGTIYNHYATVTSLDSASPFNYAAGTHFTTPITYTGASAAQTLTIELRDSSLAVLDTVVVAVPEPMTIALLGLGALFLRRRK